MLMQKRKCTDDIAAAHNISHKIDIRRRILLLRKHDLHSRPFRLGGGGRGRFGRLGDSARRRRSRRRDELRGIAALAQTALDIEKYELRGRIAARMNAPRDRNSF